MALRPPGHDRWAENRRLATADDLRAPWDTPFGRRYLSLMQREPARVMAYSAPAKRL
jgi:hypothetical protein